jgi:hypothetical protein
VRRKFNDQQERDIIEKYLAGQSMKQIGDTYRTYLSIIQAVLIRNKVSARTQCGNMSRSIDDDARISKGYLSNMPQIEEEDKLARNYDYIPQRDLDWSSGILGGEGSFHLAPGHGHRKYPVVKLKMSDRDVVQRAMRSPYQESPPGDQSTAIYSSPILFPCSGPGHSDKKGQWRHSSLERGQGG